MAKTNYIGRLDDTSKMDGLSEYTGFLDRLYEKGKKPIFGLGLAVALFGCSVSRQEIKDPRDTTKPAIVKNTAVGAPSDQRVIITEKTDPNTKEKTTTYEIKNDAKSEPVLLVPNGRYWNGWGYSSPPVIWPGWPDGPYMNGPVGGYRLELWK